MGLIEIASGKSVWRGMDYYESKKVDSWKKVTAVEYEGTICGSDDSKYSVHIDIKHPRKSTCNCPFASGGV